MLIVVLVFCCRKKKRETPAKEASNGQSLTLASLDTVDQSIYTVELHHSMLHGPALMHTCLLRSPPPPSANFWPMMPANLVWLH